MLQRLISIFLLLALTMWPASASGQTFTWNNTGGGNWNDSFSWTPTGFPNATGAQAVFGNSITANASVTVPTGSPAVVMGSLTFNNVGGTNAYTIGSAIGTDFLGFDNGVDISGNALPTFISVTGGVNAGGNHAIMSHPWVRVGADLKITENDAPGHLLIVNFVEMNRFGTGNAGGNLTFSGVGDFRSSGIGGIVPQTQSIIKEGSGTLFIQTVSTLPPRLFAPGGIFINGGTLVASSNSQVVDLYNAVTPVNVVSGATLAGSGDFTRAAVTSAGTLSPGFNSAATFPLASVTFTGGNYAVDLSATGNDKIQLSLPDPIHLGNGVANLNVNFLNGFTPAPGQVFILAEYAGGVNGSGVSGFFANAPVDGGEYLLDGQPFTVAYTFGPSGTSIAIIAVPEPTALFVLAAGLISLLIAGQRYLRYRQMEKQIG
jgi:hypothetical protein